VTTTAEDFTAEHDETELTAERNETELERWDRNLVELLQEVRVAQTGVQVLFGFLLAVAFTQRFDAITGFQRVDYFVTLLAAGGSAVLLIAPTAYHRILFRRGDKRHLVIVANRFTMLGLAGVAVAMVGAVLLVSDSMFPTEVTIVVTAFATVGCATTWCLLPLARRRQLDRTLSGCAPLPDSYGLDPVLADRLDSDGVPVRRDRVAPLR
jgi:Family of unknown function (DUF6328)